MRSVRRSISLSIVTTISEVKGTSLPEGHVQLLSRLISDGALYPDGGSRQFLGPWAVFNFITLAGRFQDDATDFMMLLVAHTFVSTNPDHKQNRGEILTALWCRYGSKVLQADGACRELEKWFTFALFGRHATLNEVRIWNKRCES
jgi:hypothetical protein